MGEINMLQRIERFNSIIEDFIIPESPSRVELYRRILSGLDVNRALHLGSGRDKRGLGTDLEERAEVIAIDPDISGLTRNVVQKRVLGDGQQLPFEDQVFDLVFSEYVFEHLPNPQSALKEIDRVLKSGGSFVVLVPNRKHYYARISDNTPFWFHKFWLKLQGVENVEQDKFPTQYEWGSYSDVTSVEFDWEIKDLISFPGPTAYSRILPIHIIFMLFDRLLFNQPKHHVAYLVHYSV